MAEWQEKSIPLKEGHNWEARPGYSVLVADRGAVRFEFPEGWIIRPGEKGSLKLMDREPPDDECTLEMSIFYLNPKVDWSGLELAPMVEQLREDDVRLMLDRGEVVSFRRGRMDVAWAEVRFMDTGEARPAFGITCIARRRNIQPLITFAYWENDAARCRAVWDDGLGDAHDRRADRRPEPGPGPTRAPPRPGQEGQGQGPPPMIVDADEAA